MKTEQIFAVIIILLIIYIVYNNYKHNLTINFRNEETLIQNKKLNQLKEKNIKLVLLVSEKNKLTDSLKIDIERLVRQRVAMKVLNKRLYLKLRKQKRLLSQIQ